MEIHLKKILIAALLFVLSPFLALAQDSQDLAKQLQNPVADLISVPFQENLDLANGTNDNLMRSTLNIQPVIPIKLSEKWNLIIRNILPVVAQDEIFPGAGTQGGLGDTTFSAFLSPRNPGPGGIIWGIGPAFLFPTATDSLLGAEKWGVGPTAVLLKQAGPWTLGFLTNQIWSFAGNDLRGGVNRTYIQPFVSYTTAHAITIGVSGEDSYDWKADEWNVGLIGTVSRVFPLGKRAISLGMGPKYYPVHPDGAPDWGLRMIVTLLFPKGK